MVKYEVGYAQSRPWPNVRFLRATKCCWGYTAVGVQNPGSTCEEDGQPSLSRPAQRVGRRWLGNGQCLTGQHGSGRRYLRLQASQAPLAPYRCPSASDACSSRREPTERASSDQARRTPSRTRPPLPGNARFRIATTVPGFPRRRAAPCVVASLLHTGAPQRREKDRLTLAAPLIDRLAAPGMGEKDRPAARLVALSLGQGGVR